MSLVGRSVTVGVLSSLVQLGGRVVMLGDTPVRWVVPVQPRRVVRFLVAPSSLKGSHPPRVAERRERVGRPCGEGRRAENAGL
jgi:hypothetical protein